LPSGVSNAEKIKATSQLRSGFSFWISG